MKLDKNEIDFENSLAPWLGKTVKMVDYYMQEAFSQENLDLTKEQMVVLKKLHIQDGLNQNELAFLTLRNKSSLTRLLTKMEAKNYIYRDQCKEDKRIKNVYLTSFGKEVFTKAKPIIKGLIVKMEQNISIEEKQQIIRILKRVQTNFCSNNEQN